MLTRRVPATSRHIYTVQKVDDNPISHVVVTVNVIAAKPRRAQLRGAFQELRKQVRSPISRIARNPLAASRRVPPRYSVYLRDSGREAPTDKIHPIRFPFYVHFKSLVEQQITRSGTRTPRGLERPFQIAALINPPLRSKGIRVNSFYECVLSCVFSGRPAARRTAGCSSVEMYLLPKRNLEVLPR